MGVRDGESTVAATVPDAVRDTLQKLANWEGISLSKYIAGILTRAVETTGDVQTISVRSAREQHGSIAVTLPPDITAHLSIKRGTPLAFATIPGGALLRPVK